MFLKMLTGFLRKMLEWVFKTCIFLMLHVSFWERACNDKSTRMLWNIRNWIFWLTVIEIETFHINTKGFQRLRQAKAKSHETETTLQKVISVVVFDVGIPKRCNVKKQISGCNIQFCANKHRSHYIDWNYYATLYHRVESWGENRQQTFTTYISISSDSHSGRLID